MFLLPAKLARKRVIVHLHGGYFGVFFNRSVGIMRSIIRFSLKDAECAIVLGRRVEQSFAGILPSERITVIPNGIPDPFRGSVHRGDASPTVLFLSTLMASKGTLDLLRSLQLVAAKNGATRSIFAGEWYSPSESKAAEQLLAVLPDHSKPEFVGAVGPSRKYELLQASAIFVLPTFYLFEGHPYVILEAMAAGLPVISTKWACIPEMVEDGVNGFLIEPGDTEQLAELILMLLKDSKLRRKMGQASRERYLKDFTFEIFSNRIRGVFETALDGCAERRQRASFA
jgi:glycosyltransferase involved in cell wall biosynthesis